MTCSTRNAPAIKQQQRLCLFAIALTLIVIVLGAYTRLSDAGLGCPDWPGCYGKLSVSQISMQDAAAFPERPLETNKAWLEMIHRYAAGCLGLIIAGLLWQSWRRQLPTYRLTTVLAILVIGQAALGMWTVTLKLMPIIVMAHLIGGFTLLSLLTLLYQKLKHTKPHLPSISQFSDNHQLSRIHQLSIIALVCLVAQIMLGGWTSSNYAALSCTSFPLCEGNWWQNFSWQAFSPWQGTHQSYEFGVLSASERASIHVSHRFGAIITSLILAGLIVCLRRLKSHERFKQAEAQALQRKGDVLGLLLVIQLSLGISNVFFGLPLIIATAHNLFAALLLMQLVCLCYQTSFYRSRHSLEAACLN